jgi:hypothetical protein
MRRESLASVGHFISKPKSALPESSESLMTSEVGNDVLCDLVLNTPQRAESRTRQSCGIFTSIGFLWPGSVVSEKQPAMAKESGRLVAVFKYLAAPLNRGRTLSIQRETIMSNATPQGAIRPNSRLSTETLQGVLAELEAAADLVEGQLVHGPDAEIMAAINRSLVEMPTLLAGDLEESRLMLSSYFHEDETPDEFFVAWIRKPASGPRHHDWIAGPFETKAEAAKARDEIRASGRYLELAETEGCDHANL